ncbi:MAG: hypothetical protein HYR84_04700 [Planctomycetes bacterium]|nr:hypothetical protein [Planctomycetota bacterium]
MNRFRLFLTAALTIASAPIANANSIKSEAGEELVTYEVRVSPEDPFHKVYQKDSTEKWTPRRGEIVRIEFVGNVKDGWNTYPISQRTSEQVESQLTRWEIAKKPGAFTPLWPLRESAPTKAILKAGKEEQTYFKVVKNFTWSQDVYIDEKAPTGPMQVPINLRIQLCERGCTWFDHVVNVKVDVSDDPALPMTPDVKERLELPKPSIAVIPVPSTGKGQDKGDAKGKAGAPASSIIPEGLIADSPEKYKEKMEDVRKRVETIAHEGDADLLGFMLAGIFWGAISLITPCVFPMIPITVSFFLKQSEKENHRPIVMASVYSVFFALSLFGMYEIRLPSSLANLTSSQQGRGGLVGTMFMALTFTIISFACVAPFLGGFGGTAAGARPWWHNILGGLAFAVTFASPFFLLALFPALLKSLPKSGSWLNSVKVVMGFLELAAAFKFFRTAELIQTSAVPSLFTFDFVLAIWIALCVLCALYLLGVFRLPHDTPEEHIGVPQLLFAAVFLGLALYLAPALFKLNAAGQPQRPTGAVYAWIDSFLLPESIEGDAEAVHTANLHWAIEETKAANAPKRIFIDFTGVSCTNCKINEKSVFTKTQIAPLFEPYIVVKLFTDTVPPQYYAKELANVSSRTQHDAEKVNLAFQKKVFGTEQLPLYAVIEPQANGRIRIVGVFPKARIDNEAEFAEWLKNPQ